ncbi:MAG: hypothetical protein ABW025_07230 [Cellulomonas sp.]
MTVRWWRLLLVWPLAFTLSVAATVLALLVAAVAHTGETGAWGDLGYVALWVPSLALVPAAVIGVPLLVITAVSLREAGLGWQVLTVGWFAAGAAAVGAAFVLSPWGPLGLRSIDATAPYDGMFAVFAGFAAGIAAVTWGLGTAAAWAVVRPVGPIRRVLS